MPSATSTSRSTVFATPNPRVFREYRDAWRSAANALVELVENFRSRDEILRAVEAVAAGAAGIEARTLVRGPGVCRRRQSHRWRCWPRPRSSWKRSGWPRASGTRRPLALRDGTAEFRDFALLVRNSEVLAEFTRAFDDFGIPYLVNRGKGFYERARWWT